MQVFVRALENSAPIEDTTRVMYGGIKSNVAVDISASRRLDIALRNIAMATIIGAFGNKKSISRRAGERADTRVEHGHQQLRDKEEERDRAHGEERKVSWFLW